jgi:hypothetical protein
MAPNERRHRGWSWWYVLFLVQFIAVLWPPFYNAVEPSWAGMPFFYWYQLLWVLIGAAINAIVYFATGAGALPLSPFARGQVPSDETVAADYCA